MPLDWQWRFFVSFPFLYICHQPVLWAACFCVCACVLGEGILRPSTSLFWSFRNVRCTRVLVFAKRWCWLNFLLNISTFHWCRLVNFWTTTVLLVDVYFVCQWAVYRSQCCIAVSFLFKLYLAVCSKIWSNRISYLWVLANAVWSV